MIFFLQRTNGVKPRQFAGEAYNALRRQTHTVELLVGTTEKSRQELDTRNMSMVVDEELARLPKTLRNQIEETIAKYAETKTVFYDLIKYFEGQTGDKRTDSNKRRKIEPSKGPIEVVDGSIEKIEGTNIMLQLPDLSIQSPFRKRLNLVFGAVKNEKRAYMALTKSMDVKPELVLRSLTDQNINFAAVLNVSEKKSLRYLLVDYKVNEGNVYKNDPILVQFNNDLLQEQFGSILGEKTFVQYLTTQLALVDFKIHDCTKESNENIFSVIAYKGSKEGYLYFLPNHVIFGFKKPIFIFNSKDIESITYTSITRLTFNINLDVNVNGITEKYEFSMIDQKEFENIDKYVKTKDVRDNSMADEHKAQKQLKNNTEIPGDLAEAAKLIPGGDQIIQDANTVDDDDDDEEDDNYQIGDSDDDHSDNSGDEVDDDNEDEKSYDDNDANGSGSDANDNSFIDTNLTFTPGTFTNLDSLDENLQQELQDLQKDLDIDIDNLQKAGYI